MNIMSTNLPQAAMKLGLIDYLKSLSDMKSHPSLSSSLNNQKASSIS